MNTFASQPSTQRKALKKALESPFIGKHGKRKTTLLKEEVYKQMQDKILEKVDLLIDAQIKIALNGNNGKPDSKAIDSLLNRVFGKPAQEVLIGTPYEVKVDEGKRKELNEALDRWIEQRK
jgi:ATPase subunit of ABC transporter with duplicated ATPase domains